MGNFDTTARLAKYIMDFTNRIDNSDEFFVDIDGHGSLNDLDYENHPDGWGCFNATITYSILKIKIDLEVGYPDYADYNRLKVKVSSKSLGIAETVVHNTREFKAELKKIVELLTDQAGPMVADCFNEYI